MQRVAVKSGNIVDTTVILNSIISWRRQFCFAVYLFKKYYTKNIDEITNKIIVKLFKRMLIIFITI